MEQSLSVLLPVHNLQSDVGELVGSLLEVLPELTPHFEVLVIDDGSTDATREAVHELERSYPQVGLATHPARLGMSAALESGLRATAGRIVLWRAENTELDPRGVHHLWSALGECDAVIGRRGEREPRGWMPRLSSGGDRSAAGELDGYLLTWRWLLDQWRNMGGRRGLADYLERGAFRCRDVEMALRAPHGMADPRRIDAAKSRADRRRAASELHGASRIRRPNYIKKLKEFALGE